MVPVAAVEVAQVHSAVAAVLAAAEVIGVEAETVVMVVLQVAVAVAAAPVRRAAGEVAMAGPG